MPKALARIVSFSGIDGAGKTTQISAFRDFLHQSGQNTELFTFWDDVVVLPRFREFLSHKAFRGDQGIGSPEKPLVRRDKNVTSAPVVGLRFLLYLADAVNLRLKVRKHRRGGADVVIFDRYIYDELANLPLNRWWTRAFIRAVSWFAPKPDVAFVVDADPAAAFARKPEYPLEFLHRNRENYLQVSRLTAMTVIEPLPIEEGSRRIREIFLSRTSTHSTTLSQLPAVQ